MTRQELVIKIREFFQTAKRRSWDNRCRYRAPNGDKCVVGSLIPDELYDPEMEGVSVFRIGSVDDPRADILKECLEKAGVVLDNATLDLLNDCQTLHDDAKNWGEGGFLYRYQIEELLKEYEEL